MQTIISPEEYRALVERLGLSAREAARILGVNERDSRNWFAGSRPVHSPAGRLLRLIVGLHLPLSLACRVMERSIQPAPIEMEPTRIANRALDIE